MKKIAIGTVLVIGLLSNMHAQHRCGVGHMKITSYKNHNLMKGGTTALRMRIIAVQDDNGNGGVSASEIELLKTEIDSAFSPEFCFEYCSVYPKDAGLLADPDLVHPYLSDYHINLLVVPSGIPLPNNPNGLLAGRGVGNSAWAAYDLGGTSVHELGHCFGLAHTFQSETLAENGEPLLDNNGDPIILYENVTRQDANI